MWIVRLTEQQATYGPFDDRTSADRFRGFLGQPGEVEQLHDPITELLNQIAAMWTGEQVPARPSVRGGAQLGPGDEDSYREEQGT